MVDVEFSVFHWPHPLFLRLHGTADLLYRCSILPSRISSHILIHIPTLDRRKLRVMVDASLEAIQLQRRTVIQGEGMPFPPEVDSSSKDPSNSNLTGRSQGRGNLLIEVSLRTQTSSPSLSPPPPAPLPAALPFPFAFPSPSPSPFAPAASPYSSMLSYPHPPPLSVLPHSQHARL